jgi:hypothetical protein
MVEYAKSLLNVVGKEVLQDFNTRKEKAMDITMDVRNVTGIELGTLNESNDYFWRELVIKTEQGEVRISLYSKDMCNEDALKVKS